MATVTTYDKDSIDGLVDEASAASLIGRIAYFGTSLPAAYLSTEGGQSYALKVAKQFKSEAVGFPRSGAILAQDAASGNEGGYAAILQKFSPRRTDNTVGKDLYVPNEAAPYIPMAPVYIWDQGGNDITDLNSDLTKCLNWFTMTYTACLCIARAGGWFSVDAAAVTFTGTWNYSNGRHNYGWDTGVDTNSTTATATFVVPADFPGGEVDILSYVYDAGGVKWSTTVDGGTAQILDGTSALYGSNAGRGTLVVQRLTGLSAGTHTIVTKPAAIDATKSAFLLGFLIAAPEPPFQVLVDYPHCPAFPVVGGARTATWADCQALNAAIVAVAGNFTDGSVVVAKRADLMDSLGVNVAAGNPLSAYVSDGVHFNSKGHDISAKLVGDIIRNRPAGMSRAYLPPGIYRRPVDGFLEPWAWSRSGWSSNQGSNPSAWYGRDRDGMSHLRVTMKKSSAGVVGETILQMPPGMGPSMYIIVPAVSWSAGVPSNCLVAIDKSGNVIWLTGTPTTELDIYVSFLGDGLSA